MWFFCNTSTYESVNVCSYPERCVMSPHRCLPPSCSSFLFCGFGSLGHFRLHLLSRFRCPLRRTTPTAELFYYSFLINRHLYYKNDYCWVWKFKYENHGEIIIIINSLSGYNNYHSVGISRVSVLSYFLGESRSCTLLLANSYLQEICILQWNCLIIIIQKIIFFLKIFL